MPNIIKAWIYKSTWFASLIIITSWEGPSRMGLVRILHGVRTFHVTFGAY